MHGRRSISLCDGGSLKWQIYKPLLGLSVDEISSHYKFRARNPEESKHRKKMLAVAELVLRVDDAPAPRGYMSAMMVDKPEDMLPGSAGDKLIIVKRL